MCKINYKKYAEKFAYVKNILYLCSEIHKGLKVLLMLARGDAFSCHPLFWKIMKNKRYWLVYVPMLFLYDFVTFPLRLLRICLEWLHEEITVNIVYELTEFVRNEEK